MVALEEVELLVVVGVLVVVDDVVVEVGVLLVVVLVDVELVDEEVLDVWVALQSWAASSLTVPAPWPRFWSRVEFTDGGRLATALLSCEAALWARPQSWAAMAADTALRLPARWLLCADESRPVLLPQATTKATVNPRPPARIAREPKPIRRLTLEAAPGSRFESR